MTVADVPSLAVEEVIKDPKNPFTGNTINNSSKNGKGQLITTSSNIDIETNNGFVFDTSDGHIFRVHDNIFDPDCWERID